MKVSPCRLFDFKKGWFEAMNRVFVVSSLLLALLLLGFGTALQFNQGPRVEQPDRALYLKQLANDDNVPRQIQDDYARRNKVIASSLCFAGGGAVLVGLLYVGMIRPRSGTDRFEGSAPPKPNGLRDL